MVAHGVKSRVLFCCLVATTVLVPFGTADGQVRRKKRRRGKKAPAGVVADYRSRNFRVHTDLPAKEAKQLLSKLEKMLGLISRYWGRRNPRVIECFVAKDLSKWPPAILRTMDPTGIAKIQAKAGVTISLVQTLGKRFSSVAKVYAIAEGGVAQHEAVHAYCSHAFGRTGPVWYSEGMAEMGQYWREKNSAVNCDPMISKYLLAAKPKQLTEIVDPNQVTGDSWQNYAWRWALCHMLANNPNYAKRFRPLGLGLLLKTPGYSFERIYGSMAKEINFEYHFFLKHVQPGFRVDLCAFDWKARFRQPTSTRVVSAKVSANAGWQPARLIVKKGKKYQYSASGGWKLSAKGTTAGADGDEKGNGKLTGVIFSDYTLSEPFPLGTYGTFTAPADGKLFVRCGDKWTEIADNKGTLQLKMKFANSGNPLPRPKPLKESKSPGESKSGSK